MIDVIAGYVKRKTFNMTSPGRCSVCEVGNVMFSIAKLAVPRAAMEP